MLIVLVKVAAGSVSAERAAMGAVPQVGHMHGLDRDADGARVAERQRADSGERAHGVDGGANLREMQALDDGAARDQRGIGEEDRNRRIEISLCRRSPGTGRAHFVQIRRVGAAARVGERPGGRGARERVVHRVDAAPRFISGRGAPTVVHVTAVVLVAVARSDVGAASDAGAYMKPPPFILSTSLGWRS
jgi:hypothetical protein